MKRIAAVLLCLLATTAEAQKTKLGPMDIFNLEYATSPEISPDGQWVVYVRQYFDVMTDRRYSNLWIARSDGSDHRPLTAGKYTEGEPAWSPDGKRLAYISTREGAPQIYVRWMDNGQTSPITKVQEPPSGIAWSPDGSDPYSLFALAVPLYVLYELSVFVALFAYRRRQKRAARREAEENAAHAGAPA